MELRTERLVLRPVTEADVDVLLAIRNAPGVSETADAREPLSRERMAGQVERRVRSWRERGFGSWLCLEGEEPVAFVEVLPAGEGSGVPVGELEVGVVVHPAHWGRGIAAEAGLAVARDLFDRVGRERVYAEIEPTNEKSLRLVAKVPGVRHVGGELYELTRAAVGSQR
ncbi:MAG TPA: GNAT family N-acetyltransferase [Gaiellaceae bacterium]|nr:GNAT family N-acetyltransferase [Gaiellaceae bacterium]